MYITGEGISLTGRTDFSLSHTDKIRESSRGVAQRRPL